MTTLPLLALAGYFLILFEYIAMRHRDICAESDARILRQYDGWVYHSNPVNKSLMIWSSLLYWNRGTK